MNDALLCRVLAGWFWLGWLGHCPAQTLAPAPPHSARPASPRARVVVVQDARATDGLKPESGSIRAMVDKGILRLAGSTNPAGAWRKFVSPLDMVGIKVYALPGAVAGTRPAVVEAVVESLLRAGIPNGRIVLWDQRLAYLRQAGLVAVAQRWQVRVAGAEEEGYDEKAFYESSLLGTLFFGDMDFGRTQEGAGRKSHVSKLVSQQLTKIINLSPLLNHYRLGVSGNLFSLAAGSVDNTRRFEEAGRLTTAIPEIYALREVGDKVALNIVDAIFCQYEGESTGLLHYAVPLNELRFSTDPVALDVLSIAELERQRQRTGNPLHKPSLELYQNAALLELGACDERLISREQVLPHNF